jgi:hypothetical protein
LLLSTTTAAQLLDLTPTGFDGEDDDGRTEVCSYQIAGDEQLNVSPTQLPFDSIGDFSLASRATTRFSMVMREGT